MESWGPGGCVPKAVTITGAVCLHVCGSQTHLVESPGRPLGSGDTGRLEGAGWPEGFHVDHQLLQGSLFHVWVQFGVLGHVTGAVSMWGLRCGRGGP